MSDLLCVTNRLLCGGSFLTRIEEIAKCSPKGIILREKDLSEEQYGRLLKEVLKICKKYNVPCIAHSFINTAINFDCKAIHLPMPLLRQMTWEQKKSFDTLGASCHTYNEAKEAELSGCTYITAGHIFATDCKKGVAPRGIDFLRGICGEVSVPVYAIGGITSGNVKRVKSAGAKGYCIMSGLMRCNHPQSYIAQFEKDGENCEI